MKLSEANRKVLLVNLHQMIEEYADSATNHLQHRRLNRLINYPPNGGLTKAEELELAKLSENEALYTALRKLLAGNTADVLFSFLNLLDGTGDPETDSANWTEVMLVDFSEDLEMTGMLHDDFFATYWDWKARRKNSNWQLDLLDDQE